MAAQEAHAIWIIDEQGHDGRDEAVREEIVQRGRHIDELAVVRLGVEEDKGAVWLAFHGEVRRCVDPDLHLRTKRPALERVFAYRALRDLGAWLHPWLWRRVGECADRVTPAQFVRRVQVHQPVYPAQIERIGPERGRAREPIGDLRDRYEGVVGRKPVGAAQIVPDDETLVPNVSVGHPLHERLWRVIAGEIADQRNVLHRVAGPPEEGNEHLVIHAGDRFDEWGAPFGHFIPKAKNRRRIVTHIGLKPQEPRALDVIVRVR